MRKGCVANEERVWLVFKRENLGSSEQCATAQSPMHNILQRKLQRKAEQTKVNDAKGPGGFQIGPFGNTPSYYCWNIKTHCSRGKRKFLEWRYGQLLSTVTKLKKTKITCRTNKTNGCKRWNWVLYSGWKMPNYCFSEWWLTSLLPRAITKPTWLFIIAICPKIEQGDFLLNCHLLPACCNLSFHMREILTSHCWWQPAGKKYILSRNKFSIE